MIKSQKLRPTPFFQRFTTVCDMFIIFYKGTKKPFFSQQKVSIFHIFLRFFIPNSAHFLHIKIRLIKPNKPYNVLVVLKLCYFCIIEK